METKVNLSIEEIKENLTYEEVKKENYGNIIWSDGYIDKRLYSCLLYTSDAADD